MVRKLRVYFLFIWLITNLSGCDRDVIGPQASRPGEINDSRRVLIINEGNFQRGNASIGYYNSETNSYAGEHYQRENGLPLGDVLESVYYEQDQFYAVLNGSNRILICDSSWALKASFEGLGAPRYLALHAERIYLSDLFKSEIGVYNAQTLEREKLWTITKPAFAVEAWQDQIIVAADKELRVYDPLLNDSLIQTITLPAAIKAFLKNGLSQWLVVDNNDQVYRWEAPRDTLMPLGPLNKKGEHFCLDFSRQEFYVLTGAEVQVYSFFGQSLKAERSFSHAAENVYGFVCDSTAGQVYIMDPEAFVAPSTIYVYDRLGPLKEQFSAGFISNGALIRD